MEGEAGFEALPEEALLAILSEIKDAKGIAALAAVCTRWRLATRYVPSLFFNLGQSHKQEHVEHGVRGMLSRSESLKCLKFRIDFSDTFQLTSEQLYSWIDIVKDSIQVLELWISGGAMEFSGLWEQLRRCSKLTAIRIQGSIDVIFPVLRFDMPLLKECILEDSSLLKFPALYTILDHCPALEKLVVKNFPVVKAKLFHSAVTYVHLEAQRLFPELGLPFIMLEAANLTHLILDGVSCVLYAPKLVELHLPSRLKDLIVVSLDNVALLTMGGENWEFDEIHSVVELVPKISEVSIDVSVSDPKPVVWRTFFHGLSNLETITLGGNMLECFCKEIDGEVLSNLKLVKVTIFFRDGCMELLKAFLVHCSRLKFLFVNCSSLIQQSEGDHLAPLQLLEAQHPQIFSDLKTLQASSPLVEICFR